MSPLRPLLTLLIALAVTSAAVSDNEAICGDAGADASIGCVGGAQHDAPAEAHVCTLCPCHTPTVEAKAFGSVARVSVITPHQLPRILALVGLDAPAPATPPPTAPTALT